MISPDILQAVSEHYKTTLPEVIRERMEQSKNSPFVETLNLLFEFSNSAYEQPKDEDFTESNVNQGESSLA